MDEFLGPLKSLGMNPADYPWAVPLALGLRATRSYLRSFGSGAMYGVALAFTVGIVAKARLEDGTLWSLAVQHGLVFLALTLILQRVAQAAADKVPWLALLRDNAGAEKLENGK